MSTAYYKHKTGWILVLLPWLCVLAVTWVFVSGDSFWIDEGNTAYKASRATLKAWFFAMHEVTGSDSQMPGYMLYAWAWEKLAGDSELALRLSNLPWLILMVLAVRRFPYAVAAVLTSPFILYYLNEFRPYMMQIAGAALAITGLVNMQEKPARGWLVTLAGCLVMSASSLLGVLWSLGGLVYVLIEFPSCYNSRWFWNGIMRFAPVFALLAVYYAWTISQGQEPSLMGGGLFLSFGAAAYELLGLAGLGPSKIDLRVDPRSILAYAWIIGPAATAIVGLVIWSLIHWIASTPRRQLAAAACGIAVPCLLLFSLVVFKDFRLLGRHLAPLSIVVALSIAHGASWFTGRDSIDIARQRLGLIACMLVMALGLAGGLSQRFAQRHRRDDYRTTVNLALQAIQEHRSVIWGADRWSAYFYGLDKEHTGWTPWREPMELPVLAGNELVVLSKPDIFDPKSRLRNFLDERAFHPVRLLPAFVVYECQSINPTPP